MFFSWLLRFCGVVVCVFVYFFLVLELGKGKSTYGVVPM